MRVSCAGVIVSVGALALLGMQGAAGTPAASADTTLAPCSPEVDHPPGETIVKFHFDSQPAADPAATFSEPTQCAWSPPAGVSTATVTAWGGDGWNSTGQENLSGITNAQGGRGGEVQATLSGLSSAGTYEVQVGGYGGEGTGGCAATPCVLPFGWPDGGSSGSWSRPTTDSSAEFGGGSTMLALAPSSENPSVTPLVVAGGGGAPGGPGEGYGGSQAPGG